MVRAAITEGEYASLRKLAIDKRMPVAELLALALRDSKHTRAAFQREEPSQQ